MSYPSVRPASLIALLSAVALLPACGDSEATDGGSGGSGANGVGAGNVGGATANIQLEGAPGVVIFEVAIYQGVKRTLMANGSPVGSEVPLIPGRDALIRVFYSADANYDGRPVTGQLWIDGQEAPMESVAPLLGTSSDALLASSVNFMVPGSMIGESFTYQVKLLQELQEGQVANGYATYPQGAFETVLSAPANKLRVVLVPFRYDADGSGRLPDLSEGAVNQFYSRFKQWYPVTDVEVSVRNPLPWNIYIGPTGQGWQDALIQTANLRQFDGATADTYYYSVFNPSPSFPQFCGFGCILGLALLNDMPSTIGDPQLRFAVGLGYPSVAEETGAHEIGHAHGRKHVNCGGPDPSSIDPFWPYPSTQIGSWGYDILTGTLKSPTDHTSFMGYCENNWVSDYTFTALHNRGTNINQPKLYGADASDFAFSSEFDVIALDGEGNATLLETTMHETPNLRSVNEVDVTTFTEAGNPASARGAFFELDHLPGGWLLVPHGDRAIDRAEFVLDGKAFKATRSAQ